MADMQWVMGADASLTEAYIENEDGNAVVAITRLTNPGLKSVRLPTDEQWQSIVDCIAAAPEMVAVLKNLREHLRGSSLGPWGLDRLDEINAVLAKAEPPRTERRKVRVQVDIEVDVPRGTAIDCHRIASQVQDRVFLGMHDHDEFNRDTTTVRAKATAVGELYED